MNDRYDVIVAGGGTAGVAAAIPGSGHPGPAVQFKQYDRSERELVPCGLSLIYY